MSTSGRLEVVLHTQNLRTYSTTAGQFREVTLLCKKAPPDELPYEGGKREDGIDGVAFQNIATLWQVDLVTWPLSIDQGTTGGVSWDDGDYAQIIRCLRGKHLWIKSVAENGRHNTTADADGTTHDLWTTGTGTILPKKVVATWGASDFTIGAQLWRVLSITLRAEKPDIGVTI